MSTREQNVFTCAVCGQPKPKSALVPAGIVRPSVSELIRQQYPTWAAESFICREDLAHFRGLHVRNLLASEKGELTAMEDTVVQSLREQDALSTNINADFAQAF